MEKNKISPEYFLPGKSTEKIGRFIQPANIFIPFYFYTLSQFQPSSNFFFAYPLIKYQHPFLPARSQQAGCIFFPVLIVVLTVQAHRK